jgi:hypothetical protein
MPPVSETVREFNCLFEMSNRRGCTVLFCHSLTQLPPCVGIFRINNRRTPCRNNRFVDPTRFPHLYGFFDQFVG